MSDRPAPSAPLTLDVDAHGRVAPGDDLARRALADRAGRFLLLPSAPDLLVARRSPGGGGAVAPPRCVLAGDLSAFPIADLVTFIHQSRLSGRLEVAAAGVERAMVFKDGEVTGATSAAPGERIGEVAVRLGYVTAAQVRAGMRSGRPLGKHLVEAGAISSADLWKCFHEQVSAVFHAVLLAREGVFVMLDGAPDDLHGTPLSMSTQALLMDAIRRIDELSLFQSRIPGPQAFLRRREPRSPVALKPLEQQLLDRVDGRTRVAGIAAALHLNEFDAIKVLYHLAEAGYVEAAAEPLAGPAEAPAERLGAICEGMNELFRVIGAAVGAGGIEPVLAGSRPFLSDPASRFAPLYRKLQPARDLSLEPAALLLNLEALDPKRLRELEPSGDRAGYLFDALAELMFFYLFQAGEKLPRAADEALAREVKRRFDALASLKATP
ncbi:DUF4388 domain-containing protein [Anaeromyxobacter paludicola]|uniref:PatA-like N-terminal domain-containing protein n=1 Tax=Anaeromyxobacter paludicola TaxID=2918171 RepID=A0ABM7XEU2_9BACT|nr:DUF4388 domain-containing protein [Anaeromyxobacter paludicola]BDG10417.1 hypothetical protein AMPC_35300 [Anaeromyxobacter paludicola]